MMHIIICMIFSHTTMAIKLKNLKLPLFKQELISFPVCSTHGLNHELNGDMVRTMKQNTGKFPNLEKNSKFIRESKLQAGVT